MDEASFDEPTGRLLERISPSGQHYHAFFPDPLPPPSENEAIVPSLKLLADANHALGQLDQVGQMLPDPDLLVRPYIRREAVLSSRIEGTKASFADLVAYEAGDLPGPDGDTREVYNYVDALNHGLRTIEASGITPDLVRQLHRQLLSGVRGERFGTPGEFRTIQNHIGGGQDVTQASFVPPPPSELPQALNDLFAYIDRPDSTTPILVELAWVHYQFETIHPFIDGNGRVGRLLIPLMLAHRRKLSHPLLYLSPFFEAHRSEYYDLLFAVSARGRWEQWLRFFLEAVNTQAGEGVALARDALALFQDWQQRLLQDSAPANATRTMDLVKYHLVVDPKMVETRLGVSTQTAYNQLRTLERLGIISELPVRRHGRAYIAHELLNLVSAGS
ncbi:MAG: Fic family protein [Dehalococcoidia bacterium]|nr:Fic family protein [Dehalococcoidia bacterium]